MEPDERLRLVNECASLSNRGVLSEEVACAMLGRASGSIQLENTDAFRRSERSLSPAREAWGTGGGGYCRSGASEGAPACPQAGCQPVAERPRAAAGFTQRSSPRGA